MIDFQTIYELAAKRKGGEKELKALLPALADENQLLKLSDDRFLALMTRCVFQAGFVWRVINQKWPGFEEVFQGFDPEWLVYQSPEVWDRFALDTRIVRNRQKITSVYDNAMFIRDVSEEYGSFARFIQQWPTSDLVSLFSYLKKQGSRLGGMSGQRFLRYAGKDSFILTGDVVARLQASGLAIRTNPTSKSDLKLIQATLNEWHQQTGFPYSHLSKIMAYSIGNNYSSGDIQEQMGKDPQND